MHSRRSDSPKLLCAVHLPVVFVLTSYDTNVQGEAGRLRQLHSTHRQAGNMLNNNRLLVADTATHMNVLCRWVTWKEGKYTVSN
jgi:hypothetical protein